MVAARSAPALAEAVCAVPALCARASGRPVCAHGSGDAIAARILV